MLEFTTQSSHAPYPDQNDDYVSSCLRVMKLPPYLESQRHLGSVPLIPISHIATSVIPVTNLFILSPPDPPSKFFAKVRNELRNLLGPSPKAPCALQVP